MIDVTFTEPQLRNVINHLEQDISYGAGGTFVDVNDPEMENVDKAEVFIVKNAIRKMRAAYNKK